MLALVGQTGKLELFNRNRDWQEQRSTDGLNEKLIQSACEIRDDLKILERVELEAEATKDYGLALRAKRTG